MIKNTQNVRNNKVKDKTNKTLKKINIITYVYEL